MPIDPFGRAAAKAIPHATPIEHHRAPHCLFATAPERLDDHLLAFLSRYRAQRLARSPNRQERETLSDDSSTAASKPETPDPVMKKDPATKKTRRSAPKVTKTTAVVGAAIGIGSAAIVAALLYTNRGTKS
ncbi:MAG: hypothetical protein V4618_02455 [Pseudomonadota bacterium]